MDVTDLKIIQALKHQMGWLANRQKVLSENVANADTPGFRSRDLVRPDFLKMVNEARQPVTLKATNPRHLVVKPETDPNFSKEERPSWEVAPDGNSINLEQQMIKVSETGMEYNTATSLYTKSMGLLRMALGHSGF